MLSSLLNKMPNGAFTELNQGSSDGSDGNLEHMCKAAKFIEVWRSEQVDKELCCLCWD